MTYEAALQEVSARQRFGSRLGLSRLEALLTAMGNPHEKLKYLHVAGTNGKGTTCTYLSAALTAAGYRTGLYTSPYVEDFRERFRICGEMIGKEALAAEVAYLTPLANAMEEPITEFEFITALAFHWFYRQGCDIVVLEVGLGGRFDATNVIPPPEVAVITSISLDHTEILGDTYEKIAFEKGGIIKAGSQVVLYPEQNPEAAAQIAHLCQTRGATLLPVNLEGVEILEETLFGSRVQFSQGLQIDLPFAGRHQVRNAATALAALGALDGFVIPKDALKRGFSTAQIAARMEVLGETPLVLLDGGHNPGCAKALRALLDQHLAGRKITAIMGMMGDKDSQKYLAEVAPLCTCIITVAPDNPRSLSATALATVAKRFCPQVFPAPSMAAAAALGTEKCEDILLICGSLYLAGEIRPYFYKI